MIDKSSETWREVTRWALERLELANVKIAVPGTSIEETENLRGQIRELTALLALTDEIKPNKIPPSDGYGFQGPDVG